jgi:glycosyltransferase involved in cell wall biosynthesis
VIAERSNPAFHRISLTAAVLRRATFPLASTIVTQTPMAADFYSERFRVPLAVIPNPIPIPAEFHAVRPARPRLVVVSRLIPSKRIDIAVEAVELLAQRGVSLDLDVYGEGPELERLEQRIQRSSVPGSMHLRGLATDLDVAYAPATLALSASEYEGFPTSLTEALSRGVPVVALPAPGVSELLSSFPGAVVTPERSAAALANAIERLLDDPGGLTHMRMEAIKICDQHSPERIGRLWEEVLQGCIARFQSARRGQSK